MVGPIGFEQQRPTVYDLPIMSSCERAEPGPNSCILLMKHLSPCTGVAFSEWNWAAVGDSIP